jgi:hypothetical protein
MQVAHARAGAAEATTLVHELRAALDRTRHEARQAVTGALEATDGRQRHHEEVEALHTAAAAHRTQLEQQHVQLEARTIQVCNQPTSQPSHYTHNRLLFGGGEPVSPSCLVR